MIAGLISLKAEDGKVLADFNTPAPNNISGNYGAFGGTPQDAYVCKEAIDDIVKHGADGSSMRLVYNVGKEGSYNGFWMKLGPADVGNNFDASPYKKLSFWIKGDQKSGTPNKLKVELKGDPGTPVAKKYVGELNADWKKVEIPLEELAAQGVDLKKLNEFVVVFEQREASPGTSGAVYIDDVMVEK